MSQALEPRREALNPITGELVQAGDLNGIAAALQGLRELKQQVADATAAFTELAVEESRRQGSKTLTAAGVELILSADNAIEWDIPKLAELLDAGLPQARYEQLVTEIVTYKVNGTVARQLAGASRDYEKIIEAAKVRIPKRRYVTVR